jgi:hypothetical protein
MRYLVHPPDEHMRTYRPAFTDDGAGEVAHDAALLQKENITIIAKGPGATTTVKKHGLTQHL